MADITKGSEAKLVSIMRVGMYAAYFILFVAGGLLILMGEVNSSSLLAVVGGIIYFANFFWLYSGFLQPIRDEREANITMKSMTVSWMLTLASICCTLGLDYLSPFGIKVNLAQGMGAVIIVMVLTLIVSKWYFGRRGADA